MFAANLTFMFLSSLMLNFFIELFNVKVVHANISKGQAMKVRLSCYHLIAKPGNKTAIPSWPDPFHQNKSTCAGLKMCFVSKGMSWRRSASRLALPSTRVSSSWVTPHSVSWRYGELNIRNLMHCWSTRNTALNFKKLPPEKNVQCHLLGKSLGMVW